MVHYRYTDKGNTILFQIINNSFKQRANEETFLEIHKNLQ